MQRKVYILENLDCANCAAKIERKLSKLPELSDVSVTFATKQLRFAAEDPEAVLPKIRETIQSMEPDVEVVERTRSRRKAAETHNHEHHHHEHGEECGCGHDHHDHDHDHEGHEHHHHEHGEECGCGHEHHDHNHDHEEHEHHHHHEHGEKCGCGHDHHHDHDHEEHEHHHHHHEHGEECGCGHDHHDHDHDHEEHEHHHDHHEHGHHHHADEVFTSWGKETVHKYTEEELDYLLKALSETTSYGTILRSKGIIQMTDGGWKQFDLVPEEYEVREGQPDYTGRICVIGTDLKEEELLKLFHV